MSVLSPDELRELTDCARHSGQVAWLRERGWIFAISRLGRPKVDRAEYELRMMSTAARSAQKKKAGPDLEWFHGASS